jgi:hypothetical protein
MQRALLSRRLLSIVTLSAVLSSCAASGWRFSFDPSPAETIVQPETNGPVVARGLATVIEGRRAKDGSETPEMRVRLLVENRGEGPVRLLDDRMKLVGSPSLESFGPPRIEPPAGEEIPPGQSRTYDVYFPYPEGLELSAPGLEGLNLSWSIGYEGGAADVTHSFVRRTWQRGYYDDPGVQWHFFFVSHH